MPDDSVPLFQSWQCVPVTGVKISKLTSQVYSWGEGEDGKLGHGNRITLEVPRLIETLSSERVVGITCGSAHSACVTAKGHLYTWGFGEYGRLGHGDDVTLLSPKMVRSLRK